MTDRQVAELRLLFDEVARIVRDSSPNDSDVSNSHKLRLYALYKRVVDGPYSSSLHDSGTPSRLQVVARAKHLAWEACVTLSERQAMLEYVQLVAAQENEVGKACSKKFEEWKERGGSFSDGVSPTPVREFDDDLPIDSNHNTATRLSAIAPPSFRTVFRSQPMVPRGHLDIAYDDLWFACRQCFRSVSMQRYCQLEDEIAGLWNKWNVVVGLSVRSLLDLYLRCMSFAEGSQVIVTPPINVPGMMDVLQQHGLVILPVDLAGDSLRVDTDAIETAITPRTVAIMVVHPFGQKSTTPDDVEALRSIADTHQLQLWDDSAECFVGVQDTVVEPTSDVSFLSFGTIKTATALGGGIAFVSDEAVMDQMKRLHYSLYPPQPAVAYLRKAVACLLMKCITESPILYGFIFALLKRVGVDFDWFVGLCIRNFTPSKRDKSSRVAGGKSKLYNNILTSQLRQRPSIALLSLLLRRLEQSQFQKDAVIARKTRCHKMEKLLCCTTPCTKQIIDAERSTYWLFPICVPDPESLCQLLSMKGWDITQGASQLQCIDQYSSDGASCPRAKKLMSRVVYLPVSTVPLSVAEMLNLAQDIQNAVPATDGPSNGQADNQTTHPETISMRFPSSAAAALALGLLFPMLRQLPWMGMLSGIMYTSLIAMAFVTAFVLVCRRSVSELYTNDSRCFAKHSGFLGQHEKARNEQDFIGSASTTPLLGLDVLRLPSSSSNSDSGRTVLLTGATGFIGSLVLRDLLLHRASLGISGGVVVLCRPRQGVNAKDRLAALLQRPMFSFLTEDERASLVCAFDADVTRTRVGLSDEDYSSICKDENILHVIHCAASISFTQELPQAADANITSALNMQKLACQLKNPESRYVHFSTAFVHGGTTGNATEPLPELLHPLGEYDAVKIYHSMLGTQFYASSAMHNLGFQNTYTFSKSICEHLLLRDTSTNTIILRPSIVGPALHEPSEGWAGERPSTLVAAACLYLTYQWNLWCFGAHRVPCIPVDIVSRFAIVKTFEAFEGRDSVASDIPSDDDFERVNVPADSSASGSSCGSTSIESERARFSIYNVSWDTCSPESTFFSWTEYAVAVTHVGAVLGCFSRCTAYIGLFFAARLLPRLKPSLENFAILHTFIVQLPVRTALRGFSFAGWHPKWLDDLLRVRPFLDLPLLFFPFMNSDFHFRSELLAPNTLDGERYLFTCVTSAALVRNGSGVLGTSALPLVSSQKDRWGADLLWAVMQPRGSIFIRLAGWAFSKILRACAAPLTVDIESFSELAHAASIQRDAHYPHVILAPTHRSFFDFILVSYIAFSLPELGLDIPYIAAADEFSRLPIVRWIAPLCNAFFLRRGHGGPDPGLREAILGIKKQRRGACIVVFMEGKRSRDRRFLAPKTGFLRCLAKTEGDHLICPISINYETIPEQATLLEEVETGVRRPLAILGLFHWLQDVFSGKVSIGKIHVAASTPIRMTWDVPIDFRSVAQQVQREQQTSTFVSMFHIRNVSKALHLDEPTISKAVQHAGCRLWPEDSASNILLSQSISMQWAALLHLGHSLAPYFTKTNPSWSTWLDPIVGNATTTTTAPNPVLLEKVIARMSEMFDLADSCVDIVVGDLQDNEFTRPSPEHIVQITTRRFPQLPIQLVRAAASFRTNDSTSLSTRKTQPLDSTDARLLPTDYPLDSLETLGSWGFRDSRFILRMSREKSLHVTMIGSRYEICEKPLTKLVPFIENETRVRINPLCAPVACSIDIPAMQIDLSTEDIHRLTNQFERVSTSPADRARHGTGHSQEDIFLLRHGSIDTIRVPDVIVWPSSENETTLLISLAKTREWCLIPHGGGTNVSNATRCPSRDDEPRPIISVDMKLMNRVLWVNEVDGLAHIEAGITGRRLVEELETRGYTMGHEPDSIEFSTLGGWIATKASGMKRNKYGNIEDIVVSVRVAGSEGLLWRGYDEDSSRPIGRESRGVDLCSLMMGSEGSLGIITSAVLRIWPLPECKDYESVLLRDMESGVRFVRELALFGANLPASVRLLDNEQFRLGQALRADTNRADQLIAWLKEGLVSSLRSLSAEKVVCATIAFEGNRDEVRSQRKLVQTVTLNHGGVLAGSRIGRSGYHLTFVIAYLRDFAMNYSFLGESFETFVPWSKLTSVLLKTKYCIRQEHEQRCLPGQPFIACRVTQLYREGACLYFYFCMNVEGVKDPSVVFTEIEQAARRLILSLGGSLSHHHGVGKKRADLAGEMDSDSFRNMIGSIKGAIDPSNIFGARNGLFR